MIALSTWTLAALAAIGFGAGVGNTGVGTGGVFVTIGLYAFTPLSTGAVAGTALATFALTGALGAAAYRRSGELVDEGRTLATVVGAGCGVGVLLGTALNAAVPEALFGRLLAGFAILSGFVVAARTLRDLDPVARLSVARRRDRLAFAGLGLGVGTTSGLLGIGGLALVVPALLLLGTPLLRTIAVGQAVSALLSAVGAVGYLVRGTVALPLVVLVGAAQVAGALVGWRVAHRLPDDPLRLCLSAVLVVGGLLLLP